MEIESRENEKKKYPAFTLVIQTLGNWRLFHIANLYIFHPNVVNKLKERIHLTINCRVFYLNKQAL